jgi:hypothetical protein
MPASVAVAESEIGAVPVPVAAEVPVSAPVAEPEIAAEPLAPTVPAEAEAVVASLPARAEPIAIPAPIIDVEKALEESGLVLIQTDPGKVKPVEPVAEPQFVPAAPRPRRPPPADTGPLQIVETKK